MVMIVYKRLLQNRFPYFFSIICCWYTSALLQHVLTAYIKWIRDLTSYTLLKLFIRFLCVSVK